MFTRRLQKYIFPLKLMVLVSTGSLLGFIVVGTAPDLSTIGIFLAALSLFLYTLLSFFLSARLTAIIVLLIVFLLTLRVFDLFTPVNLALFVLFLSLLSLYLYKK